MNHATGLLRVFAVALALLLVGGAPPVGADDGRVPLPALAKAKGEQCVEPTDVMRRNHMDLLTRQRDETMRLGIRGGKYSLSGCIDCHATPDPAVEGGEVRTIAAFCDQCHAYAAVKPDCFGCHTAKAPAGSGGSGLILPADRRLAAVLRAHLAEGSPSQ